MLLVIIAIIVIVVIVVQKNRNKSNDKKAKPSVITTPLLSQNKIDKFLTAYSSSNISAIQEAAEDLFDEYICSYQANPIQWNECNAIMDCFKTHPICYDGKKYPQYSGMLCEEVIRLIRTP